MGELERGAVPDLDVFLHAADAGGGGGIAVIARWSIPALGCVLWSAAALSQEESVSSEQTRQWAAEAARLAAAEVQSYQICIGDLGGPRLALVEQPVLKWSNTYDATVFGSAHIWAHDGRPEAIACIYKYFTTKDEFSAEIHSLAETPLVALKRNEVVWRPAEPGVVFKPVPQANPPAATAVGRLSQMRQIARGFSAELTTVIGKTRHNLRLLPQPLFRYPANEGEVTDGAVFAFARATDPDVVLLLEARRDGANTRWRYALARMHVGALRANYLDQEVWSVEELSHPYIRPNGPYTTFQNLPEP
jgi:hypothetical protein